MAFWTSRNSYSRRCICKRFITLWMLQILQITSSTLLGFPLFLGLKPKMYPQRHCGRWLWNQNLPFLHVAVAYYLICNFVDKINKNPTNFIQVRCKFITLFHKYTNYYTVALCLIISIIFAFLVFHLFTLFYQNHAYTMKHLINELKSCNYSVVALCEIVVAFKLK